MKKHTVRTARSLVDRARVLGAPRRFHAYCVGAPKTGTMSIAGLFTDHYRVAHEPEPEPMVALIGRHRSGAATEKEIRSVLRARDRRLRLELESSNPTSYFVSDLVELFPDARFILTIRDCYSWTDSYIDHQLNLPIEPGEDAFWGTMRDAYLATGRAHEPGEEVLAERGTYPLAGFLGYWADHNRKVLDAVPPDRLLVIRTPEIGRHIDDIAAFLDVPADTLNHDRAHLHTAPRRHGILDRIDPELLERQVDSLCRDLMDRYFPDIRSLADLRRT
jgi:hypothetical protein